MKRQISFAIVAILLLGGLGVGIWSTYTRAHAATEEVYDVALSGLWVGGEAVDFAAVAKLTPAQQLAAFKNMKGKTFYAEGRIYAAGTGNTRGTTPAGTYYCIGAIIADFDSPTPKLSLSHELWAITGKGEINTLGLETVSGPPPGFQLEFSVASGTGRYWTSNMAGSYRRVEIDPDGKSFSGDEILRGYFTRWQ